MVRAQWQIRRARRLQRLGRHGEAFGLALPAFGVLYELAGLRHPPASTLLMLDTVFLDELARQVGWGSVARPEVARALELCEEMAVDSPKLAAILRPYIAWYKQRLAEEPETPAH